MKLQEPVGLATQELQDLTREDGGLLDQQRDVYAIGVVESTGPRPERGGRAGGARPEIEDDRNCLQLEPELIPVPLVPPFHGLPLG